MSISNLLTISFVFVLISNVNGYVGAMGLGINRNHFYMVFIVIAIALFSLEHYRAYRRKAGLQYQSIFIYSREVWTFGLWCLVFNMACLFSMLVINSEAYAIERYIAYTWVSLVSITFALHCQRDTRSIRFIRLGVLLGTLVMAGVTFVEYINPEFRLLAQVSVNLDEQFISGNVGRVGGLWVNANQNGNALVFGMFASMAIVPVLLRMPYALLVGLAVLATVSRSSIVLWVVALICLYFMGDMGKKSKKRLLTVSGVVALIVVSIVSGQIPKLIEKYGYEEYVNENIMDRLSGNFFDQEDSSTEERTQVVLDAIEGFKQRPVFGFGLGSSRAPEMEFSSYVGTHNSFAQTAVEQGTLGLFTYFLGLLLVVILNRSWQGFSFFVLFSFANLFSHTLTYQVYVGLILVLTLVLIPASNKPLVFAKSSSKRRSSSSSSSSSSGSSGGRTLRTSLTTTGRKRRKRKRSKGSEK